MMKLLVATLTVACTGVANVDPGVDPAVQERLQKKAQRLVEELKISDAAKAARAQQTLKEWLLTLHVWHGTHDVEISRLWDEWSRARAVVPKDEYPGEVVAHRIDDVYASLKPDYAKFIDRLKADLSQQQIDALKERWSHSPGMMRTYNAYLETVHDLTDEQKGVILDRMKMAREDAMLTDADREIVSIYKRHKVKVEQYVGSLQWAKLHKAYASRGTTQPTTAPAAPAR